MSDINPLTGPPLTSRGRPDFSGTWMLSALAISVASLAVAVIAMFLPLHGSGSGANGSPASASKLGSAPKVLAVSLGDLFVKPDKLSATSGEHVTLLVHNTGKLAHDLTLSNGKKTAMLQPNGTQTLDLGIVDASLTAWCSVPGHKDAGMKMDLEVAGGAPASSGSGAMVGMQMNTAAAATQGAGRQATPTDATIDFAAMPPEGWKPRDPSLPPADPATVHEITLHATEKVMEVAPGVTQQMWTFNDTVPGPTLHGKLGDTFRITLVNDGKLGHSIDLHASRVAWNDKMRTINPGESLVYEFTADYAGIFMYHCGTAPALHHIGNGMYGAIIIDPPDLKPVDHEYVVVQSELYLGPQGQPGDLAKMMAQTPDAVVFNGYANGYKFAPIRVEPNQRVRVWVLDAGPSENSAFHIVGTIFDTVFKEGTYLLQPDARRGGSQVLDLQPAQGGFVEFSLAEKGFYPMVTHKFANVGKGALGLFQAGDVPPVAGGH